MIIQTRVLRNDNLEEILDQDINGMPFLTAKVDLYQHIGQYSPWHWHGMFELTFVASGSFDYDVPGSTRQINEGDFLFINSSVLHTVKPHEGCENAVMYCILFDSHFLSGLYNSKLEEKYFRPIRNNSNLSSIYIAVDNPANPSIISDFKEILRLDVEQPFAYEFMIQKAMANLWGTLLEEMKISLISKPEPDNIDVRRLKKMIIFIKENYGNKVLLEDIAQSANISIRECSRCFKKNMNITPMEFLNKYRIDAAAELLIRSDLAITAISEECGFSSNSYFTSVFSGIMGCTPKKYRQKTQ